MLDDADPLAARLDRAKLDLARGRLDAAEPAYHAILAECRASLGPDHANTARAEHDLATLLEKQSDWAGAASLDRVAGDRARKAPGNSSEIDGALADLGRMLVNLRQWPEALAIDGRRRAGPA